MADNDNFNKNDDFILARAKELLGKCGEQKSHDNCSLMDGGRCPLLSSSFLTIQTMMTKQAATV